MRIGLLLTLVASVLISNEVNAQPSGEETEQWISQKIGDYGYASNSVSNKYEAKFFGNLLVIASDSWTPLTGTERCLINLSLINIAYISITEHPDVVWLNIVMKPGDTTAYSACSYLVSGGRYSMIFRKSFMDDNMLERMRHAFSRLIELQGGSPLPDGEPY